MPLPSSAARRQPGAPPRARLAVLLTALALGACNGPVTPEVRQPEPVQAGPAVVALAVPDSVVTRLVREAGAIQDPLSPAAWAALEAEARPHLAAMVAEVRALDAGDGTR
jgi:hypothetical protein